MQGSNNILLIKWSKTNYINEGIDTLYLSDIKSQIINIKDITNKYEILVIEDELSHIILISIYHKNLFIYSNFTYFTCSEYIKYKILNSRQPLNNYQARIFLIIYIFVYKIVKSSTQIYVHNIYNMATNVRVSFIKEIIQNNAYWIPTEEIIKYYADQTTNIEKKTFLVNILNRKSYEQKTQLGEYEQKTQLCQEYEHKLFNNLFNFSEFNFHEEYYFDDMLTFILALKNIEDKVNSL